MKGKQLPIVEFTTDKAGNYIESLTGKPMPEDVKKQLREADNAERDENEQNRCRHCGRWMAGKVGDSMGLTICATCRLVAKGL